ncbi:MAG: ATP-grasp domain-containing protein [Methylococcales bacterium]
MNKIEMTRAFWSICPANVPHTLILPNNSNGLEQVLDEMSFPLVIKEPRNSMGRGVFLVDGPSELRKITEKMEVLYVQEYLPVENDLRIVFVGESIAAAYWRRGGDGFHHNIAKGAQADFEAIPEAALNLVDTVVHGLGLDYAGFDVAMVDGHPFVFEFNLLFGNLVLNACGIHLGPGIVEYLKKRLPVPPPRSLPGTSRLIVSS